MLCNAAAIPAAPVTIDERVTHQTIEGFGAHGSMNVWWGNAPFYNDQWLDLVVNDLGLSMTRNEYYPKNEKADIQKPFLQALNSKAQASGKELRFIFTVWTPPAGWKWCPHGGCPDALWNRLSNGVGPGFDITGTPIKGLPSEYGGLPNYYPDYADYLMDAIDWYQNTVGVDLYALSFANEPDFAQSFNSCVWAGEQYRDFVRILGPKMEAKDPSIKLFGAERMLRSFGETCAKVLVDPRAAPYLDVVAVHGYSDGVEAENLDLLKSYWGGRRSVRSFIHGGNPANKEMSAWMTETSGYSADWDGAMQLARSIYYALCWGDVSAWVWWQLCSNSDPNVYELMSRGTPTERYYASKHFYRWIRPDAVRIDATTSDSTVELAAFHHDAHNTLTVVAINPTVESKQISLNGSNLPSTFEVYLSTSSSQNCARQSDLSSDGTLTLPPNSITTLYGDGYDPPELSVTPHTARQARALRRRIAGQTTQHFDLYGRVIPGMKATAAGVRILRSAVGGAELGTAAVVNK